MLSRWPRSSVSRTTRRSSGGPSPAAPGMESTLLVRRERYIGAGMREDIVVRNVAGEPAGITVEITVDSDFADLFAVKEGRTRPHSATETRASEGLLVLESTLSDVRRGVRVKADGALTVPGKLIFREVVPPRGEWHTTLQVLPTIEGAEVPAKYPVDEPVEVAGPSLSLQEWTERTPIVWGADQDLLKTLSRSEADLGALRMFDPDHPERTAVAAGAPWFMALFGRDSLLTAYMALLVDPALALGTLQTLAELQGSGWTRRPRSSPAGSCTSCGWAPSRLLALGGRQRLLRHRRRHSAVRDAARRAEPVGLADSEVERLLPHADRALALDPRLRRP